MIKIALQAIIADEEATNALWFTMGASGMTPCGLLCSVYMKQRASDAQIGVDIAKMGNVSDVAEPNLEKCGLRSDADVWAICSLLEGASKQSRAADEPIFGIKFSENALLYCKPLRRYVAPSCVTGDPMHILFSGGLLGGEVPLFMSELGAQVGGTMEAVRQYHADGAWEPPPRKVLAFSEKREQSSNAQWKAQASELLSAYPILRAFIVDAFGGADPQEPYAKSMLLLMQVCDRVRILLCCPDKDEVRRLGEEVTGLARIYLAAFVEAYGREAVRFKHHQLLHLGAQIVRNLWMLSCWVAERKNLSAKLAIAHTKAVDARMQTAGLSRMLADQVRRLAEPGWRTCLLGKSKDFPEMALELGAATVRISKGMKLNGLAVQHGDVLFPGSTHDYLVVVVACVSIDAGVGMLVRQGCRLVGGSNPWASAWQVDPEIAVLRPTAEQRFLRPAFHRYVSSDVLEVLH